MYVATKGPKVKWGGTDFKWGAGHHCSPAGDDPGSEATASITTLYIRP